MKIAYPLENVKWSLENNILPKLSDKAMDGIIQICEKFNREEIGLNDKIAPNTDCTVGEMFEDLKIDIE